MAAVDVGSPRTAPGAGGELGVEELEAAGAEAGDEVDEGDLRGVALTAEHALAEERRTEDDAVEAAHQSPSCQASTVWQWPRAYSSP